MIVVVIIHRARIAILRQIIKKKVEKEEEETWEKITRKFYERLPIQNDEGNSSSCNPKSSFNADEQISASSARSIHSTISSLVLISNFNFDEIALDLLEKFNLPLNGAQLKSLLAGILMTVISLLRQIIQRTPQLSSLTALTNPVLTMSSSMPVGGGNSLN